MADDIVVGPGEGTLRLHTTRTGAAAKMGHDLTIEVRRWSATLTPTDDNTGLLRVSATAEAASCEVVEGSGGAKALTDKDRRDIKASIDDKVLQSSRYPQITFLSDAVEGMTLSGRLSLAGVTRPWEIACELDGDRVRGRASIVQSDFGIKLYSALLGALKVGDVVGVSIDLKNPRA